MKINNIKITAKSFAYDGCHKIYLLESEEGLHEAAKLNYQILPIEELPEIYETSCPLRFINTWDELKTIVSQFAKKVKFTQCEGEMA